MKGFDMCQDSDYLKPIFHKNFLQIERANIDLYD